MSDKLKHQLRMKLARQQAAVKETAEQLDWIEQQEANRPPKAGTKPA